MKNIFTLLSLLLIFSFSSKQIQAQNDIRNYPYGGQAKLSISSSYSNLRVMVDGNTYNVNRAGMNDDFILNNLPEGNHSIRIWKVPVRTRGGVYNNQVMQVIYDAVTYLRNGYQTDLMVNRFGRIFKDEQYTGATNTPGQQSPNQYPGYNQPMSPESFSALKSTITNEAFDNSRQNIAKQAAQSNYFTSTQVKEIVQLFSYDNSRLEIAKALYSRTVDKQNYFMVNDAFSYSNSKDELMKYISQNP